MKLSLSLAAVLLMAVATPAAAQRGGSPGDSGRFATGLRATAASDRIVSRDLMRNEPGDNQLARRRWNAANDDTGTRIRRRDHHPARRRWNAANGNDR